MTDIEIDELVQELQANSVELYHFIMENCDGDLTNEQIDNMVSDFESDYLSLREFVVHAIEE